MDAVPGRVRLQVTADQAGLLAGPLRAHPVVAVHLRGTVTASVWRTRAGLPLDRLVTDPDVVVRPGVHDVRLDLPWGSWTQTVEVPPGGLVEVALPAVVGVPPLRTTALLAGRRNAYVHVVGDPRATVRLVDPVGASPVSLRTAPTQAGAAAELPLGSGTGGRLLDVAWTGGPRVRLPVPPVGSLALARADRSVRAEPLAEVPEPLWDLLLGAGRLDALGDAQLDDLVDRPWPNPLLGLAAAYAARHRPDDVRSVVSRLRATGFDAPDLTLLELEAAGPGARLDALVPLAERSAVPLLGWGIGLARDLVGRPAPGALADWRVLLDGVEDRRATESVWSVWSVPAADRPHRAPHRGDPLGSRYVLEEEIGGGASGRVYRAGVRDGSPDVAVKVLRPGLAAERGLVTRLVREAEVLRAVDHANVLRVLDLVVESGRVGVVTDLLPDGDLRDVLPPPQRPALVLDLLADVAEGLAAVHVAGVVHRDLKPENVLLERRSDGWWNPIVADFGISSMAGMTVTGLTGALGTPAYLSPEVAAGRAPGPEADVYALGVMAFEWLSGERPFEAEITWALLEAHRQAPPPRLLGAPPVLQALLDDLMAKAARDRPSAREAADRLRALARSVGDPGPYPVGPAPEGADVRPGVTIPLPSPDPRRPVPVPAVPVPAAAPPEPVPVGSAGATAVAEPAPRSRGLLVAFALAAVVVLALGIAVGLALR